VTPLSAVIIGAVGGVLVVLAVLFFERIRIDDPVGAISVHAVNGVWGTLSAGLFHIKGFDLAQVGVQALGIAACFLWVFPTTFIMFKVIAKTIGLRVSPEEELEGLDISEHAGVAYPDFEVISHGGGITAAPSAAGLQAEPSMRPQMSAVKQT
jgi:Amt family ammonium transporter